MFGYYSDTAILETYGIELYLVLQKIELFDVNGYLPLHSLHINLTWRSHSDTHIHGGERETLSLESKRLQGLCPLTLEETSLVLQALGFEKDY